MRVAIAAGGTGGHLFPAIALAEEFTTRHPENRVVFVGTERGLEVKLVPKAGFDLKLIDVAGVKGRGIGAFLKALWLVPKSILQSRRLLKEWKPDIVIGVGGYVTGPALIAAWMLGLPTAVLEPNSIPGITNKILGRFVSVVFTSYRESEKFFSKRKVQLLGNPIRRALAETFLVAPAPPDAKFHLLVFGGSQGARGINDAMIGAAPLIAAKGLAIAIVHQTGGADRERVEAAYAGAKLEARVVEFIDDMASAYVRADLVVCRAGASTLSELTVCRKASVLVPFPFATDNHQEKNARALADHGAAILALQSELDGAKMASILIDLAEHRDKLRAMEQAAGRLARPQAAKEIADCCVELWKHGLYGE